MFNQLAERFESIFRDLRGLGKITDSNAIKWDQDGIYKVKVKGTLKMHGVSKVITIPGQVIIKEGKHFLVSPKKYVVCTYAKNTETTNR